MSLLLTTVKNNTKRWRQPKSTDERVPLLAMRGWITPGDTPRGDPLCMDAASSCSLAKRN
jgi:hypothetical protein